MRGKKAQDIKAKRINLCLANWKFLVRVKLCKIHYPLIFFGFQYCGDPSSSSQMQFQLPESARKITPE